MKHLTQEQLNIIKTQSNNAKQYNLELIQKHEKDMKILWKMFIDMHANRYPRKSEERKTAKYESINALKGMCKYYFNAEKFISVLETLALTIKYLKFINNEDIDDVLSEYGFSFNSKSLQDIDSEFYNEDTKQYIISALKKVEEITSKATIAQNKIATLCFEELPNEIKYDDKLNRSGLKLSTFKHFSRLDAIKDIDEDKGIRQLEKLESDAYSNAESDIRLQSIAVTLSNY